VLFTGHYEHAIDAKFRVAIPSEIRGRMDPEKDGSAFYAIIGPNGAIWLWPEKTFERMADDMERSMAPGSEMMEFDEVTFPEARWMELDKTGRIRLPEQMLAEAGIDTKVVILGMRNRLELRDPAEWGQRRQANASRRAEIARLARPSIERGKTDAP